MLLRIRVQKGLLLINDQNTLRQSILIHLVDSNINYDQLNKRDRE